jgi:hypothetical protein
VKSARIPALLRSLAALLLLAAPLLAPDTAWAASPAGTVTLVTGRGTASSADLGIRTLAKGDPFYSGDVVHSSANSYVDLHFTDGGYFLLRPNSRFQVTDFADHSGGAAPPTPATPATPAAPAAPAPLAATQQAQSGGASRAFFSLLKGGFRSISGLIGKINHDEYQVTTPVATIGIRGTDYLVVICDVSCATDPQIQAAIPPGIDPTGGIVSTVYSHSIVVTDAGGTVILEEGQYLLVLPNGTNILLPTEPHFLHVDPTPDPATCAG